jgi:hypothetical protein
MRMINGTCALEIIETIAHIFWDYRLVGRSWGISVEIVNNMKATAN